MHKRILAFILCPILLMPMIGCSSGSQLAAEETETAEEIETALETADQTETAPQKAEPLEQSPWEQKVLKVLILGNSHSNDLFFQLARVFEAQGFDQPYVLGFLYYSGCSLLQHVEFGRTNQAVYDYYKSQDKTGKYTVKNDATLKEALKDQQWDIIFFQHGSSDLQDETLRLNIRRKLEAMVDECVPTVHSFAWHSSWPAPSDPELLKGASEERKALLAGFGNNPINQFNAYSQVVQKNILTDDTYVKAINTGSAMLYATQVLGVSDKALYRDYTHASDLGRVLVSYAFYAQFTGQPIEEVKLDKVPESARKKKGEGDLILTDTLKSIIKESANYAFEHPWEAPV